jgi:uncharacterized membrane protein YagU involved in acid resistance
MKSNFSIKSAVVAGLIATVAMTMFTFMAALMGFEMDIPKMLSSSMSAPIVIGWLAHFMIGTILAINYASIYLPNIKQIAGAKSGAIFSIISWLMVQIIVMPMMSMINGGSYTSGLFSGSIMIAMASLIGHLLFGVVLGLLYKQISVKTVIA